MKNALSEKDIFKSSDLALIAATQLFGYSIEKMERENPTKVTFIIKRDKNLDRIVQDFWSRKLSVEPLAYFESLKFVKSRIYNQ